MQSDNENSLYSIYHIPPCYRLQLFPYLALRIHFRKSTSSRRMIRINMILIELRWRRIGSEWPRRMGTNTRKMWKEIGWVQKALVKVLELYNSELPRHIAYNIILIHLPSIITGSGLPVPNTTSRGHQSARLID